MPESPEAYLASILNIATLAGWEPGRGDFREWLTSELALLKRIREFDHRTAVALTQHPIPPGGN